MRFMPRAAVVAALLAPAVASAQVGPVAGDWYGTLSPPGGAKLPVVFHIQPDGSATLDSPAQGATGLQASATLTAGKITLTLKAIPAAFVGTVSADGKTLTGVWGQNGGGLPLVMGRAAPTAVQRPQTPKAPFPYRAEDVTYANSVSGLTLAATLTLPQGPGPFPAVVLITGSGPQDRDETLFDHKPFLVIADALTRRGVAVLRVDDRGVGGSQSGPPTVTSADFATDVEAGVAWLRRHPDIAGDRIGLLGHSEGGMIAPMVAAKDPKIAFMVLLAAPGVDGAQLLASQAAAIETAMGAPESYRQTSGANRKAWFDAVLAEPDDAKAQARLLALLDQQKANKETRDQVLALTQPWWRYTLGFQPARYLKDVRVPVLALGGSKDLQVPAAENLVAIKAALPAGGDVTTHELPSLNHLLQTAKTGLVGEYGQIEETIAPAALSEIVDWTAAHAQAR